jgi:hypothetical protein
VEAGSAVDGEAATGRRWRERGGRGGRGRAREEKVGRVLTLSFLLITGNATYRASVCPDALRGPTYQPNKPPLCIRSFLLVSASVSFIASVG